MISPTGFLFRHPIHVVFNGFLFHFQIVEHAGDNTNMGQTVHSFPLVLSSMGSYFISDCLVNLYLIKTSLPRVGVFTNGFIVARNAIILPLVFLLLLNMLVKTPTWGKQSIPPVGVFTNGLIAFISLKSFPL